MTDGTFTRDFTELLIEQLTNGTTEVLQRIQDMANATDDPATTLATITGAAVLLTTETLIIAAGTPDAAINYLRQLSVANDIEAIFTDHSEDNPEENDS